MLSPPDIGYNDGMIEGHATPEGTKSYAGKFLNEKSYAPDFFDESQGLCLSSVGIGTYLGEADDATGKMYEDAIEAAILSGCNVIDSAINYRFQLSERNIGNVLEKLTRENKIKRDEILLCTKGGYIPFDGGFPKNPAQYLAETFVKPGIITPKDVVAGCHCMTPKYLDHQLNASMDNLKVKCIDVYYIHNPEQQLDEAKKDEFYKSVRAAFEVLEKAVSDGKIKMYGTATWNGYRNSLQAPDYLSLEDMVRLAREAGGDNHHFKAIQLPLNFAMLEALAVRNQGKNESFVSALESAEFFGMSVFCSASMLQGQLARGLTQGLHSVFPDGFTDAQIALQFVRSSPGVTTALCGMKQKNHVDENLQIFRSPRMTKTDYMKLFATQN